MQNVVTVAALSTADDIGILKPKKLWECLRPLPGRKRGSYCLTPFGPICISGDTSGGWASNQSK